jgi:hypothetical protein
MAGEGGAGGDQGDYTAGRNNGYEAKAPSAPGRAGHQDFTRFPA